MKIAVIALASRHPSSCVACALLAVLLASSPEARPSSQVSQQVGQQSPGESVQGNGRQPSPRPSVVIDSPANGEATNAAEIVVQVSFEAWTDPDTGERGNVQDIDLLLDGTVVETIENPPNVAQGSVVFRVNVAPLTDGALSLVAHAYQGNRQAGLRAVSTPVSLLLDRTPPVIDVTWPPQLAFTTALSFVEIEGMATDGLSGVVSLILTEAAGTVALTHPAFATVRNLNTGGGAVPVANDFTLLATDAAGNSTRVDLRVDHSLQSSMIPIDPTRTEVVNGITTSIDQAMIVFLEGTSRSDIDALVRLHGGRVAGHFTSINTALAVFQSVQSVAELQGVLATFRQSPEVVDVQVSQYIPSDRAATLDNDALGFVGGAYASMGSSAAVCWMNANPPAGGMNPVDIAVIDSGLDPTFGLNNEFAGIDFVDACNNPPQPPTDLSGHGTRVTGVIAGRNNGSGNNGVTEGVNGGAFSVTVYRTTCTAQQANANAMDSNAILFAMDDIEQNGGVDLVNMSFGLQVPGAVQIHGAYRQVFQCSQDTLWIASAGNGGPDCIGDDTGCNDHSPSGFSCQYANVLGVAAHDWRNWTGTNGCGTAATGAIGRRSQFSNFGQGTQISAPSPFVWSATGVGGYNNFNGTSAAAPLVTGTAALVLALADLSPGSLRALLVESADPLMDDPFRGLNALSAVTSTQTIAEYHVTRTRLARGRDAVGVPAGTWSSTPGLSGFYFDYVDDDHHIDEVAIGLAPSRVDSAYNDQNDDDEYQWRGAGWSLPAGTTYGTVSGSSGGGSATSAILPGSGVYVLTGFRVDYDDDDHHLDEIGVEFVEDVAGTRVLVTYNDQNDDDDFTYTVDFAVVPLAEVSATGRTPRRGPVRFSELNLTGLGLPAGLSPLLLTGFRADFEPNFTSGDDHHIDELGFEILPGGAVNVWFNDKNDDDAFFWYLDWVELD